MSPVSSGELGVRLKELQCSGGGCGSDEGEHLKTSLHIKIKKIKNPHNFTLLRIVKICPPVA